MTSSIELKNWIIKDTVFHDGSVTLSIKPQKGWGQVLIETDHDGITVIAARNDGTSVESFYAPYEVLAPQPRA